ncbi:MAG: 2-octaprenyl-6-methoxyphenyl hydroxylase [Pseudomonadota bacterium]
MNDYDVVIVGGGLVGASLAVALAPLSLKVALVETAPFPETKPSWDERCIGLNEATRVIFERMGVWAAIRPEAEPILSTHISERGRFGVARFTAQEAGLEALGYNTPMRTIGGVLWKSLSGAPNVRVICPAQVTALTHRPDAVRLTLSTNESLTARLVVAADGAQSAVRRMHGIGGEERNYGQTAIVGAVKPERAHHGVAYERFTPDGPIAVLPRHDNACVSIWTVPTEKSKVILGWDDERYLAEFQSAFGNRLGRFLETGRRSGYPLSRVMSEKLTAARTVFAGNAAQTLHPVAAQGFNLGLRDVATLAGLLMKASDPGAPELLHEYEARREQDRSATAGFTDRLVRTFSNDVPGLRGLRHLGLLALDLIPPVKESVMRQNLGQNAAL